MAAMAVGKPAVVKAAGGMADGVRGQPRLQGPAGM
jgi:hypothetical protein